MTRATILCALVAAFLAGQSAAQSIPVPFSDTADTRQISVTVAPGIRSMSQVRDRDLQVLREQMHAGEPVSSEGLRALADLGDGLAAQRYVRRMLAEDEDGIDNSDIAYYAAIAVGSGRVWTLPEMVAAMHRIPPGSESQARINKYMEVLYAHAWEGNTLALDAVQAFNGEGRLFGPLSEATRQQMLDQARANGDGRVEIGLALRLMERFDRENGLSVEEMVELNRLLERAANANHLGVSVSARAMIEQLDRRLTSDG